MVETSNMAVKFDTSAEEAPLLKIILLAGRALFRVAEERHTKHAAIH
jgi:hypothetical protein